MNNQDNISVITTNALGFPPFIFHKAILFYGNNGQRLVIHRTTSGVEITGFDSFMKGRKILHKDNYPVKYKFDPYGILLSENKHFDWINNNCEDFTSDIINRYCDKKINVRSPQRAFWFILVFLLITILAIIK